MFQSDAESYGWGPRPEPFRRWGPYGRHTLVDFDDARTCEAYQRGFRKKTFVCGGTWSMNYACTDGSINNSTGNTMYTTGMIDYRTKNHEESERGHTEYGSLETVPGLWGLHRRDRFPLSARGGDNGGSDKGGGGVGISGRCATTVPPDAENSNRIPHDHDDVFLPSPVAATVHRLTEQVTAAAGVTTPTNYEESDDASQEPDELCANTSL